MVPERSDGESASLDRAIEELVGRQLRAGLSAAEFARLQELMARKSRMMRPGTTRRDRSTNAFAPV